MQALGEYLLIRVKEEEEEQKSSVSGLIIKTTSNNDNHLKGIVESVGEVLNQDFKGQTIYFSKKTINISIKVDDDRLCVIEARHALLKE